MKPVSLKTMHKASTFFSNANAAEREGTPFGTVPRQTGQRCERETLLCHNQTAHSEWGKFCPHKLNRKGI